MEEILIVEEEEKGLKLEEFSQLEYEVDPLENLIMEPMEETEDKKELPHLQRLEWQTCCSVPGNSGKSLEALFLSQVPAKEIAVNSDKQQSCLQSISTSHKFQDASSMDQTVQGVYKNINTGENHTGLQLSKFVQIKMISHKQKLKKPVLERKVKTTTLYTNIGKKFNCRVCGEVYLSLAKIQDHVRSHSFASRFTCEVCGKPFSTKVSLKNHQINNSHNKVKLNSCEICKMAFKYIYELDVHMLSHIA